MGTLRDDERAPPTMDDNNAIIPVPDDCDMPDISWEYHDNPEQPPPPSPPPPSRADEKRPAAAAPRAVERDAPQPALHAADAREQQLADDVNTSSGRYFSAPQPWQKRKIDKHKKKPATQLFCDVCDVTVNSQKTMDMHIKGRAHRTKLSQRRFAAANKELDRPYQELHRRTLAEMGISLDSAHHNAPQRVQSQPPAADADAVAAAAPVVMEASRPVVADVHAADVRPASPSSPAMRSPPPPPVLSTPPPPVRSTPPPPPMRSTPPPPMRSTPPPPMRSTPPPPMRSTPPLPMRSTPPPPVERVRPANDDRMQIDSDGASPPASAAAPHASTALPHASTAPPHASMAAPAVRSPPRLAAPPCVPTRHLASLSLTRAVGGAMDANSSENSTAPSTPRLRSGEPISPRLRSERAAAPRLRSERVDGAAGAVRMEPVMKPIPWDPYVREFKPELVGKYGGRVPQDLLDARMSLSEWRELRRAVFEKGDDVDKLAFKIMAEMLLSPTLGVREDALTHMNNAMKKMKNVHYYSRETGWYMAMSNVPEKLWKREARFVHGDVQWMKQQSAEDKALHLICENLHYMFDQGEDYEVVADKAHFSALPFRGGVTGWRSGVSKGIDRDGGRGVGDENAVEKDELFEQIHQFLVDEKMKAQQQQQQQQQQGG